MKITIDISSHRKFFFYFYDIIILLELIQVIILTRLGMNKKGSRGNVTIMKFIESKWPYALNFLPVLDSAAAGEGRVIMSPPLFQLFSLFFLRFLPCYYSVVVAVGIHSSAQWAKIDPKMSWDFQSSSSKKYSFEFWR